MSTYGIEDYFDDLNNFVGKEIFPDPNNVGQSEYRAIVELLGDAMEGEEPATYEDNAERMIGILQEMNRWSNDLIKELAQLCSLPKD